MPAPQKLFSPFTKSWAAMPRYRLKGSNPIEYFFAARFRQQPRLWFLWNNESVFSVLDDDTFMADFAPSNAEARKMVKGLLLTG